MKIFNIILCMAFILYGCETKMKIQNGYFEAVKDFYINEKNFDYIERGKTTEYFNIKYGSYIFSFTTESGLYSEGKINISKVNLNPLTLKIKNDGNTDILSQ